MRNKQRSLVGNTLGVPVIFYSKGGKYETSVDFTTDRPDSVSNSVLDTEALGARLGSGRNTVLRVEKGHGETFRLTWDVSDIDIETKFTVLSATLPDQLEQSYGVDFLFDEPDSFQVSSRGSGVRVSVEFVATSDLYDRLGWLPITYEDELSPIEEWEASKSSVPVAASLEKAARLLQDLHTGTSAKSTFFGEILFKLSYDSSTWSADWSEYEEIRESFPEYHLPPSGKGLLFFNSNGSGAEFAPLRVSQGIQAKKFAEWWSKVKDDPYFAIINSNSEVVLFENNDSIRTLVRQGLHGSSSQETKYGKEFTVSDGGWGTIYYDASDLRSSLRLSDFGLDYTGASVKQSFRGDLKSRKGTRQYEFVADPRGGLVMFSLVVDLKHGERLDESKHRNLVFIKSKSTRSGATWYYTLFFRK